VKTLHPGVHGGILAIRGNASHMDAIKQHNIKTIDLVSLLVQVLSVMWGDLGVA
jgi:AICAR transformylase/IMP cyclohydrolase PurH